MSWLDTIFKFIGNARYNSVTPALSNGQMSELQCDASGRLLVSTQPVNTFWSDAGPAVSEKVIKNGAGKLHQIFGRNTEVDDLYIFIFNHTPTGPAPRPAPTSTAEMFTPIKVRGGESFSISLPRPRAFSVGLYWAISSTDASFTYASAGRFVVAAEYE